MSKSNSERWVQQLPLQDALFVFALAAEAAGEFEGVNKLVTGAGKVNAAYSLTKAICQHRPGLVVNLGSAGSSLFERGQVICCNRFIQRDMDATGLGCKRWETPFSGVDPVLEYGIKMEGLVNGTCGTGDNFEMNHVSTDYHLVDMEAYSLALVSLRENVPFLCLKYISDGADHSAGSDWNEQVHHAAVAFREILFGAKS